MTFRRSRNYRRSHKRDVRPRNSRRLTLEPLESRQLLAVDWRNPVNGLDVTGDGATVPIDALNVINEINNNGSRRLADQKDPTKPFWDTTGDQFLAPLDALQVINALNAGNVAPYRLSEGALLHSQSTATITLGQDAGTRTYRLQIEATFDRSDGDAVADDVFAVYLVDPTNFSATLLDRGQPGTTLFTLSPTGADYQPGRVRWDGSVLELDVSALATRDTGVLKFQLLVTDGDTGTRVTVRPLTNEVDPEGTTALSFPAESAPQLPGPALNLIAMAEVTTVDAEFENVRFDETIGRLTAEVRLHNEQGSIGRNVAVAFPDLPAGVTLRNASGTTETGAPYLNWLPAMPRGGLIGGDRSQRLLVEFDDPAQTRFTLAPQILAGTNHGPTLNAIGPLTTSPGAVLRVPLVAADQDGDAVTFAIRSTSSAPVQLPTGTLGSDGILEFRSAPDQLGSYTFEVVASDGVLEAAQTVTLTVVADSLTTTRVSGQVLMVNGEPLANMPVEIGAVQGLTMPDGSFTLDLGSGPIVSDTLKVRGELFAGPLVYPFIAEKLAFVLEHDVFVGVNNVINRPIFLPALDIDDAVQINPNVDSTVRTAAIPGIELFVKAGTLMNQQSTPFTGKLSITEVPVDLTPAALPEGLFPDLVVTIQPGEMVFAQPAPLDFPNTAGWSPGVLMDLWSINPVTGEFDDVGDMQVSADGQRVETISGGVRNSSWHFPAPPPEEPEPKPDSSPCDECDKKGSANSVVDFSSGEITETHALATYESLGESRGIELVYNSLRADPRPILHASYDDVNPNIFSVPSALKVVARASVDINGIEVVSDGFDNPGQFGLLGGENFWSIPAGGGPLDVALQVDLTDQPTGFYPYALNIGLRGFTGSRFIGSADTLRDNLLHVNTIASPFGAGWGIVGLQELVTGPVGEVMLIDGDGGELVFDPPAVAGGPLLSPPGDFSKFEKLVDGTLRRTMTDGTVYSFNVQGRLTSIRDRNSNETRYEYGQAGNLVKFIDPVGLETTFAYTGDCGAGVSPPRTCSITDPAGRVTGLQYDAAGNLIRVTDPDGSARNWEYDARHHMTAETDKRGFREQSFYDEFGRFTRAIRADGSVVELMPAQVRGLYDPDQTDDPANAPLAARTATGDAVYTARNGNVIRTVLDAAGQEVSSTDNIGALPTVERNAQNLMTRLTDARGHESLFTYDARGNVLTVRDEVSMAAGHDFVITYDPKFSQTTSTSDELGHQTLYDVDPANGNLRSMTEVVGLFDAPANGGTDDVVTQFTYTPQGLIDTLIDPLGRVTDFDYNLLGRLSQVTLAKSTLDEGVRHYEYDAAGNQTAIIDENGHRTEYEYDLLNRLTRVVEADPDGTTGPLTSPVTSHLYDGSGNLIRLTDARGNVTRYEYDALDRQIKVIDPNLSETQYGYDSNDNVTSLIDELGQEAEYRYDARGRLIESIDPDGGRTQFEYDLDDNSTAIIDPVDNRTEFAYDSRSRTIREAQRGLNTVVYSNDFEAAAGPEWSIDRLDRTPVGNRGFLGQFANETVSLGLNGLNAHDEVTVSFDLYLIKNWFGNQVTFAGFKVGPAVWDLSVAGGPTLLHTTFSTFALPDTTPCGPDRGLDIHQAFPGTFPGGNNEAMTGAVERKSLGYNTTNGACDPRSSVYHLSFTFAHSDSNLALNFSDLLPLNNSPNDPAWGLDNVSVSTRSPDHSTFYAYDAADNLTHKTDRNGRETQYAYDDLDRLTTETWVGGGNVIRYAYDKPSNLTSATDSFSSLAVTHDARDRVKTVNNAGTPNVPNVVLTYSYDAAGNVLSMADAIGGTAAGLNSYDYDALDRMTQITQSGTGVAPKRVDFAYNPLGQFASINRFSDLAGTSSVIQSNFEYDTLNRLTSLRHRNAAGTEVSFFNFLYDDHSRIRQITDVDGVTTYGYDDRDQLTAANHTDDANPDEFYAYDPNGNRESSHLHNTGYQTGPHNRLLSDGKFVYRYDDEGNLVLRTEMATGNVREFQWDYRNRLIVVIDRDAGGTETQRVQFTYDAFGRRISKAVDANPQDAVDAVLTQFVYDGSDVLLDFVDVDGAAGLSPPVFAQRYLHGPLVDQVLAMENASGDVLWHLSNHLGSVTHLVDNSGAVLNHLVYDSYGSLIVETNPTLNNRYLYTGRELDSETDLYYYRARYYEASTGQFVSEDPLGLLGTQPNLFSYVYASPVMLNDPAGLFPPALVAAVLLGLSFYTAIVPWFEIQPTEPAPILHLDDPILGPDIIWYLDHPNAGPLGPPLRSPKVAPIDIPGSPAFRNPTVAVPIPGQTWNPTNPGQLDDPGSTGLQYDPGETCPELPDYERVPKNRKDPSRKKSSGREGVMEYGTTIRTQSVTGRILR